MKKIEAVIRPEVLEAVKQGLLRAGHAGLHAENVVGHGHQGGVVRGGRGGQFYVIDMIPKVKLTLVVPDEKVASAVDAIIEGARTPQTGDGKIFVSEVQDAIRVRTGERGPEVL